MADINETLCTTKDFTVAKKEGYLNIDKILKKHYCLFGFEWSDATVFDQRTVHFIQKYDVYYAICSPVDVTMRLTANDTEFDCVELQANRPHHLYLPMTAISGLLTIYGECDRAIPYLKVLGIRSKPLRDVQHNIVVVPSRNYFIIQGFIFNLDNIPKSYERTVNEILGKLALEKIRQKKG